MHPYTALLFLVSMATLALGQMGDEWVITIDTEFQDVTFYCNSTEQVIPSGFYPELWMLPDLANVDKNFSDGRISVLDNGYSLEVRNASKYDFGLYHCMTQNDTGEWYLVKQGLNSRGPYFEDTWELYQQGTIIGLSACCGFLAVAFLIWMVAANQWVAPDGWYTNEEEDRARGLEQGYTNNGYQNNQTPEGAQGYVAYQDNIGATTLSPKDKKVTDQKDTNVMNGKPCTGPQVSGIEMEKKASEAQRSGDDMITEL